MTYTIGFAETAVAQLEAVKRYIASAADPVTAASFVDAVIDHCLDLDEYPHRGAQRDDLRPGLRTISYRKRVNIAFVIDEGAHVVTILGVFYGGQDFEAVLRSESPQ